MAETTATETVVESVPWVPKDPIVYSASGGESIGSAWQKQIAQALDIYEKLVRLRNMDASPGTSVSDVTQYQLKLNTTTMELLGRNKENTAWYILGKFANNWGITAAEIGALPVSGTVTSLTVGLDADKPLAENSVEGALYISTDQYKMYRMGKNSWSLLFSLNIENLLNYDKLLKLSDASSTPAAGAVVKAGSDSKIGYDTTGSADKICGLEVNTEAKADGYVLVYRDASHGFVMEKKGGEGGSGGSDIDDSTASTGSTYSSSKIENLLKSKADVSGNIGTYQIKYDSNGRYSQISTGTKIYDISWDKYGRLDTVSDGTATVKAQYNAYGQYTGMEEV